MSVIIAEIVQRTIEEAKSFEGFVAILRTRGLHEAEKLTRPLKGRRAGKIMVEQRFRDVKGKLIGALEFIENEEGFLGIAYVKDVKDPNVLLQAWLDHKLNSYFIDAYKSPEA